MKLKLLAKHSTSFCSLRIPTVLLFECTIFVKLVRLVRSDPSKALDLPLRWVAKRIRWRIKWGRDVAVRFSGKRGLDHLGPNWSGLRYPVVWISLCFCLFKLPSYLTGSNSCCWYPQCSCAYQDDLWTEVPGDQSAWSGASLPLGISGVELPHVCSCWLCSLNFHIC